MKIVGWLQGLVEHVRLAVGWSCCWRRESQPSPRHTGAVIGTMGYMVHFMVELLSGPIFTFLRCLEQSRGRGARRWSRALAGCLLLPWPAGFTMGCKDTGGACEINNSDFGATRLSLCTFVCMSVRKYYIQTLLITMAIDLIRSI
jgi:hypothetical protein